MSLSRHRPGAPDPNRSAADRPAKGGMMAIRASEWQCHNMHLSKAEGLQTLAGRKMGAVAIIGSRLLCQLGYERLSYKSRANYANGDRSTVCFIGHGCAAITVTFRNCGSLCCLCAMIRLVLWTRGDVPVDMLHEHLAICESLLTSRTRKGAFQFKIASLLSFSLRNSDRSKHGIATGNTRDVESQGGSRCMAWVASQELGLPYWRHSG